MCEIGTPAICASVTLSMNNSGFNAYKGRNRGCALKWPCALKWIGNKVIRMLGCSAKRPLLLSATSLSKHQATRPDHNHPTTPPETQLSLRPPALKQNSPTTAPLATTYSNPPPNGGEVIMDLRGNGGGEPVGAWCSRSW
jgi:hypothetical protein